VQRIKAQSAWQPAGSAGHRTSRRKSGWLVLLLVWVLCGALGSPFAFAQKGKKNNRQSAKKKKKKLSPKAKKPATKKKTTDTLADLKRLPSMNIHRPLLTKLEYEQLEKSLTLRKYTKVLRNGVLGSKEKQVIADWAKWRVLGMTRPENHNELYNIRRRVLYEVGYSAKNLKGGPGTAGFRMFVMQQVAERCEQVLDNNYYVRLQAVMILGNLNLKEYDPTVKPIRPPTAYGQACKPLLEKVLLVSDAVQPDSIKIAAAVGVRRIALLAPRDKDRSRAMAAALIKEFNRTKTHPWYQCRLAEALAAVELKANPKGEAIILQTLGKAVVDLGKARKYPVRAQAAMSLGRASLVRDVNIDLLMYEIVNLGVEMSEQYNADLAAGKALPSHWTNSFLRLYFAFNPVDRLEEDFLYKNRLDPKDRNAGFRKKSLPRPQMTRIESAYQQIKQIVKHVVEQSDKAVKAPVPAGTIADLKTWMANNTPKYFKVQPGSTLPALRAMKVVFGKPKAVNPIAGQ
jgi:hypothetical protein